MQPKGLVTAEGIVSNKIRGPTGTVKDLINVKKRICVFISYAAMQHSSNMFSLRLSICYGSLMSTHIYFAIIYFRYKDL